MDFLTGSTEALSELLSGKLTTGAVIFYVLIVIAYWKIFEKADMPGWLSLIPIVNIYFMFKLAWGPGWIALLLIVPLVNIVIHIIMAFKLSHAFDKGFLFALGLMFLTPIFALILGFDSSEYILNNNY